MPTNNRRLLVTLPESESDRLEKLAKQLRLTQSEVLRRLLMNSPLPDQRDFEASQGILDLLSVNADLARLGNLLKLVMDEPLSSDLLRKYDELANQIKSTQDELKDTVRKVDNSIGRGAK
ncbi:MULTISPECIES: plasmid mobilization protein [Thalassospira]|uniref:Conjugal transfer protein TraJ n=1 Tax=Thalassospira lohafexi TaxID=744227 RepID=A0A2N3L1A2_9PROT|nr:ribbon-helix-helix protein, CopG family [Thalassospira lohafexi]PKR56572.1 conjugal transfer protein TraJ [Thalassospira lohafexi]